MKLKLKTTRCKLTKPADFRVTCSCRAEAVLMTIKMRIVSQWWINNTVNPSKRTSSRRKPWKRTHIKSKPLIQTRTVFKRSKFKTIWVGYVLKAPKRCPLQSNRQLFYNNSNSNRCRSTWWINSICKALLWASGLTLACFSNNSSKWTMPSNSKCSRISKFSIHSRVVLVNLRFSSCLESLPSADQVQPDGRHSSISVRSSACQALRMSLWDKLQARRPPRPPARSILRCISCAHELSIKSASASMTMSWSRGWLQTIWRMKILVSAPNFKSLRLSCNGRIKWLMT